MSMPLPTTDPTNIGNPPGAGPLRAGGVSVSSLPAPAEANLPSTKSPAVVSQQAALTLVGDLWAGNERLHELGAAYLPQAPGEDLDNYRNRLARAVLFNRFRSTIEGLVGYVFRADPELGDDVPAQIKAHWENIDNAGSHGDVFLRARMTDAMRDGHGGILVDFPKTDGLQSAGEEMRGEVRPYWVLVRKGQVVSWRTVQEGGKTLLRQLVLEECTEVDQGLFGVQKVTRYRVLFRERTPTGVVVGFRLLQVEDQDSVVQVDAGTYPTQDEIPFAEITTSGREGMLVSTPPFLDLAYLNLAHYRQWSDYDTSIHKTCVPIWVETGVDAGPDGKPAPIKLGPNMARRFTKADANARYEAHDGAALAACKQSLDDLTTAMADLGLAALASSKRVAETATAKELDKGATDSALAVNARGLQDGAERALYFHARYLKQKDGGSLVVNREYNEMVMDAATMTAWATLAEKLGVPVRLVLEALQEGGRIPEDANLDEIEMEMMANQAAAEARRQQELAARALAMATSGGTDAGAPA